MSDGTLAQLPSDNVPSCLSSVRGEDSVMLLLPHNKYLLGRCNGQWIYSGDGGKDSARNVSLYDGQGIELLNDYAEPTRLTAGTVSALRRELMAISDPPGSHKGTVFMLRTFMRDEPVFASAGAEYLDEGYFLRSARGNDTLIKAYWTLRLALSRGELETISRLKAWLKAGPEVFADKRPGHDSRIWFSLLDMPDADAVRELEELSFSPLELKRMSAQNASPVVLYNQLSGWLVLGRLGRMKDTMFFLWAYLSHELWNVLRERRKLTVNDIVLALWGEYDTRSAMSERAKYKGAEDITE